MLRLPDRTRIALNTPRRNVRLSTEVESLATFLYANCHPKRSDATAERSRRTPCLLKESATLKGIFTTEPYIKAFGRKSLSVDLGFSGRGVLRLREMSALRTFHCAQDNGLGFPQDYRIEIKEDGISPRLTSFRSGTPESCLPPPSSTAPCPWRNLSWQCDP